jgi:hypothetical protein
MAIAKPLIFDSGLPRQPQVGDLIAGGEQILASNTSNALTITGAMLLYGNMLRAPTAAATDTIDSAANLIAALVSGMANSNIQPGTTFRARWICTTAFAITVQATANTGVTVNRGSIAASSAKEFLVTIVNGTPAQTVMGLTTNTSAVITGVPASSLALLTVGMVLTNAQAGLQGATIIAINIGAGTITMSTTANATNASFVAFSFSPVVQLDGLQQGAI